jgi:hypothetical protein
VILGIGKEKLFERKITFCCKQRIVRFLDRFEQKKRVDVIVSLNGCGGMSSVEVDICSILQPR